MKKVAIVIVTYNRIEFLKNLIDSIKKLKYKDYDIICVNNSSTDGTEEWLKSQNEIKVITQENCGGAGGFHTGVKYASENGYEYVWLMDDDVLVDVDSLSILVDKALFLKNDFGFLCSKVIDGNSIPCNVPGIDMRKNKTGDVDWNTMSEFGLIKVTEASFVSFFTKIENVIQVGLPYKEFFIWGDDTEYSLRLTQNTNSYFVCESKVSHLRKTGSVLSIFSEKNKFRIKNYYYFYRNGLFVSKKYKSKMYVCYRYCRALMECLYLLLTGRFYKFYIVCKGINHSLFFKPIIKYPCH